MHEDRNTYLNYLLGIDLDSPAAEIVNAKRREDELKKQAHLPADKVAWHGVESVEDIINGKERR